MEKQNNEPVYRIYTSSPKEKNPSFFKNAFVPFFSSALGTFLIISICLGMPDIRNKLLNNTTYTDTGLTITQGPVSNTVSLTDYSNTAIAVANKVLPSIVGITVEYKVNSLFGGTSTSQGAGSGIIVSSDGYIVTNNHVMPPTLPYSKDNVHTLCRILRILNVFYILYPLAPS